jgi:hypothetical protein|tara:strand:- start:651 stop:935 length:285 start_codon:yes stop_codon:yes gene_type:complete
MNNKIKQQIVNPVDNRIDRQNLKFRFFGYTINKEEFKFNVNSYDYKAAVTYLWKMLDPNYVWILNCEMPGRDHGHYYEPGNTRSISLVSHQNKN